MGAGALLGALLLAVVGPGPAAQTLEKTSESGPVKASVRLTPAAPRIGDVVELELEVHAEPQVELLMPEFGDALGRFAILDFAPSEEVDAGGGTLARQRYRLQTERSGPQSIPPLLVEFVDRRPGHPPAPEGTDAYELLTERIPFEVQGVLPADAPLTLEPARGPLGPRAEPGLPWWGFALGAGVLLAGVVPLALRALAARRALRRRRSAWDIARSQLDALLAAGQPAEGDAAAMDAFYVKLSDIVRHYLENRFALRSPELTTEEFLDAIAGSPDLFASHQELLRQFLRGADLVKFAKHLPGSADVAAHVAAAERFLEETRQTASLPLRPGADASPEAARA
jgi:hypothetical protein